MQHIQNLSLASSQPSLLYINDSQSASGVNYQLQLASAVRDLSMTQAESRLKDIQAAVDRYVGSGNDFKIARMAGCARQDVNKLYIDDDFQNNKYNFDHQGNKTQTHFYNDFHKSANRSIDTITARENYKSNDPKVKNDLNFFASSVLLAQLAAAAQFAANNRKNMSIKNPINLIEDVPKVPPSKIIRDTIDNEKTKNLLLEASPEQLEHVSISARDEIYSKLILESDNGKSTRNFLCDYNTLNIARNQPQYDISTIDIMKSGADPQTGWKMCINISKA